MEMVFKAIDRPAGHQQQPHTRGAEFDDMLMGIPMLEEEEGNVC